jgi:hypothetical protein
LAGMQLERITHLSIFLLLLYKKKTTDKNLASSFSYAYASALGI